MKLTPNQTLNWMATLSYQGKSYWLCRCKCGKEKRVLTKHLLSGAIKSCGCYPKRKSHGHTSGRKRTPTYWSWVSMNSRCKPNHSDAKYYAQRGIKICDRWQSFENFLADMGERPDGTSLDRINNDEIYEPGNCRWATKSEQMLNRRSW